MKKLLTILVLSYATCINAQSMEDLYMARDDAQTYLQHYLTPAMSSLMYDMNNNWYHRAKTHKLWGFDIQVSLTAGMIPEEDKKFDFTPSEYNFISLQNNSGSTTLPTIAGEETNAQLVIDYNGNTANIDALDGLGDQWPLEIPYPISFPFPMIQASVGVPFHSDFSLRFTPNLANNGVKFNLFGMGIKHYLTPYFSSDSVPGIKLSALAAFTRMKVSYTPDNTDISGSNQKMTLDLNTYTLQILGEKKFGIVTLYGSAGYTGGITGLGALGTYEFDMNDNGTIENDEIVTDPLDMRFDIGGIRASLGASLTFGPVGIFADYTFQKYAALSTGIYISIR